MATDSKGRRARRQFDDDFKTQAVRLVLDEGKTVPTVARELDLTETALREWVHRARANRITPRLGPDRGCPMANRYNYDGPRHIRTDL